MLISAAQDPETRNIESKSQIRTGFSVVSVSQQTLNDNRESSYAVFGFGKNLTLIEETSAILPQGKLLLIGMAKFNSSLCADQFETSTSPPRAYPGHLTLHRARGGGNLNLALEGWGI